MCQTDGGVASRVAVQASSKPTSALFFAVSPHVNLLSLKRPRESGRIAAADTLDLAGNGDRRVKKYDRHYGVSRP